MKVKFIAADLDDTLMRPDKSVSDYTIRILRRCREERGIPVCFVTARSLKASERAIRLISPEYTVTCGGALCMSGDNVLLKAPLAMAEANDIIRFCLGRPSVKRIQAETVSGEYFVSSAPPPNSSADYAHAVVHDFSKSLECDVYKLVVKMADESDRRALMGAFPNARIYNYIGGATCFIASKSATKLRGLELMAAHFGARLEETAAFGDDVGDADYLDACGYSVAVENAVETAKCAAKFICGPNSADGVALWIEENVL